MHLLHLYQKNKLLSRFIVCRLNEYKIITRIPFKIFFLNITDLNSLSHLHLSPKTHSPFIFLYCFVIKHKKSCFHHLWLQLYHRRVCCRQWVSGDGCMSTETKRIQLYCKKGIDRKRQSEQSRDKRENGRTNRILIGHLYKLLSAALWYTLSSPASAQRIPSIPSKNNKLLPSAHIQK